MQPADCFPDDPSDDPSSISLLFPGMHRIIRKEAAGRPVSIEHEFDKITVSMGGHSIGIPRSVFVNAIENDDYAALDRAAVGAVRYLKSFDGRQQFAKRRAFRTRQRSILARKGTY